MASQASDQTSVASEKEEEDETERKWKGKEKRQESMTDTIDKRVKGRCEHHTATDLRTPGGQVKNENSPVTNGASSSYGTMDTQIRVCQACQHLYDSSSEVVLSPSSLQESGPHPFSHPSSPRAVMSMHRPWAARRYEGLCECDATGNNNTCLCQRESARAAQLPAFQNPLPYSASWWPRVKVAALVVAAVIPWVFLVTYIILTYT